MQPRHGSDRFHLVQNGRKQFLILSMRFASSGTELNNLAAGHLACALLHQCSQFCLLQRGLDFDNPLSSPGIIVLRIESNGGSAIWASAKRWSFHASIAEWSTS